MGAEAQVAVVAQAARQRQREVQPGQVGAVVREHHALRHRGGAGCEQQLPDVVAVDLHLGFGHRPAVDQVGERGAAADRATTDGDGGAHRRAGGGEHRLEPWPELGVDHGEPWFGEPDQVLHHVRGEGGVERYGDHAGLRDPDLGEVGLDRVLAEQQNPVAGREACRGESVCELVRDRIGLPVGDRGETLVAVGTVYPGQRAPVRVAPDDAFQDVADRCAFPSVDSAPPAQRLHIDERGGGQVRAVRVVGKPVRPVVRRRSGTCPVARRGHRPPLRCCVPGTQHGVSGTTRQVMK